MKNILIIKSLIIVILLFSFNSFSKDFIIEGNQFTDEDIVISLIEDLPDSDDESQSNFILKKLLKSGLFKNVEISYDKNNFYINILEYPSINKYFFSNNERIKDDEINNIINELEIFTLSDYNITKLIEEIKKIYQSFGYNNIEIDYKSEILSNNSADVYLDFIEGSITKIKNINIFGNNSYDKNIILSKLKSKTKKITNIFANNNYKLFQINNDSIRIKDFYKKEGYRDVKVDFNIEYFPNNKVEINYFINEGDRYYFANLKILNKLIENKDLNRKIDNYIKNNDRLINEVYNISKLDDLEFDISEILEQNGIQYFEIAKYEKITNYDVDILIEILPTEPVYINEINIIGNTRTYDYVFRRELNFSEGDPINDSKIKAINKKLNSLKFIGDAKVTSTEVSKNTKNIDILVNETQTGSFNVGLSLGTLDGVSFVSGLKENNINGTGRTLEFLINTNDNNQEFILSTSDKFFINNKVNHGYSVKYKENDFSNSKSYKLNTFALETNLNYLFSNNTYHTIGFGYSLKDYQVTNSSSVSNNIKNSEGESISFNLSNNITRNTLNSFIRPSSGYFFSFVNYIETPSSSFNGLIKNTITGKKYYNFNQNIISVQGKAGNIVSINNNEILSDDKFALGGRWLRGFDNYGAGPRNSRSDYVGGNNLLALKLDFSKPITSNSQNPIYLNLFNDYGSVWGNKDTVASSDNDIRASYGFGINYYSPIGPIGFTWGFPIVDKDYDIKRMFLFSIGNLN